MIDNTYPMPFGRHKGKAIGTLSANYLVQVFKTNDLMVRHPEIKEYIQFTCSALLPKKDTMYVPLCSTMLPAFIDKQAADNMIKLRKHSPHERHKFIVSYQCSVCGYWHHKD